MSHEIEIINGKKCMAFSGAKPWHINDGEGTCADVTGLQLTPMQMLKKAQCDWKVYKAPAHCTIDQLVDDANGKKVWQHARTVLLPEQALVRDSDGKVLDTVTDDWEPVQNQDAMEFFNDFVMAGDMEMETVGSLKGGQIVWGLAKVKESFSLFRGDKVQSYLLFSNFHKYGNSTTVMFTPVRVVCNNTLTLSLSSEVDRKVKFSHRRKFNPDDAKEMLGVAKEKLAKYKEYAALLGSVKAKKEDIVEYFKRILPNKSDVKENQDKLGKNAQYAYDILEIQPGAKYAAGTWWQPFNAVTFFLDHEISRTADQRMKQAWYGTHRTIKTKALELALEYAK